MIFDTFLIIINCHETKQNKTKQNTKLFSFGLVILLMFSCLGSFSQPNWTLSGNATSNSHKFGTLNDRPIWFITSNSEQMRLTQGGRLGIGITTPQNQLHIHGTLPPRDPNLDPNATEAVIQITNFESGTDYTSGLLLGVTGNNAYLKSNDKNNLTIRNMSAYMTFRAAGRIDFFGTGAGSWDTRLFLDANSHNGFYIKQTGGSNKYGMRIRKTGSGNALEVIGSSSGTNKTFVVRPNGATGIGNNGQVTQGALFDVGGGFLIDSDGAAAIGTGGVFDPQYILDVGGKVRACEIKVSNPGWCDYVFEDTYQLMPILQLEKYINTYKHLPEVPSTSEVEENGMELAKMNAILLKKIEELTLYMIEMQKQLDELKKAN